jgi:hypothetical protein
MKDVANVQLEDPRLQRLHRLLSDGGPAMSETLSSRLAAIELPAPRTPWSAPAARVLGFAAAAVVVAATVALLAIGSSSRPSLAEAARLSALPAASPAPAPDAARPTLLRVSFAGLRYPEWKRRFGWRVTGVRSDSIGGRRTETVFYRHTHHRIGYTVVGGSPLRPPANSARLLVGGIEIHAYKDGIRDVIVFVRRGHTCILAGFVHHRSTLLELATWNADGAIAF